MSTQTGIAKEIVVKFDYAVERHTTAMFEAIDRIAQDHDLDSTQVQALFRERCGDMEDVYFEWISESWEPAP